MARGRYVVYRTEALNAFRQDRSGEGLPSSARRADALRRAAWPIAGLYARSYERAIEIAQELFGQDILVDHYEVASGWKDDGGLFLVNERGNSGVRYRCKVCGKKELGKGAPRHNHHRACPYYEPAKPLVGEPPGVYRERE